MGLGGIGDLSIHAVTGCRFSRLSGCPTEDGARAEAETILEAMVLNHGKMVVIWTRMGAEERRW